MMPIITPEMRRRRVRARVSTPEMPGTLFCVRYSWSVISALPVAGEVAVLADDQAADLDAVRLDVEAVDAVVAEEGVGHDEDLAGEGGVGERLLVAGHAGREDDLAVGGEGAPKGSPS